MFRGGRVQCNFTTSHRQIVRWWYLVEAGDFSCVNIKRYNYYAKKFWHDKFIFEIHAQTPREVIYVTRFTMRFSMYLMNQSFYLPTQCKKRSVVSDTNFCHLICLQITNKMKWILGWLIYCARSPYFKTIFKIARIFTGLSIIVISFLLVFWKKNCHTAGDC